MTTQKNTKCDVTDSIAAFQRDSRDLFDKGLKLRIYVANMIRARFRGGLGTHLMGVRFRGRDLIVVSLLPVEDWQAVARFIEDTFREGDNPVFDNISFVNYKDGTYKNI